MGQVAKWDLLYCNRGNWSEGEMLGQIFLTTENSRQCLYYSVWKMTDWSNDQNGM